MKKILVISDTHLRYAEEIPSEITELATKADLIFHAGDIRHEEILDYLKTYCDVIGVRGNMDHDPGLLSLPIKKEITIEGIRIGLIHGTGLPGQVVYRAHAAFDDPDLIIFGHSHFPFLEQWAGVTMLNPGSSTDVRNASGPTYGWIEITGDHFEARIYSLDGNLEKSLKG